MESRAGSSAGLTYVAFTATPKAKTLELFGRPGPDGLPQPFHVDSMRQAIEEGFILDVLKNYTSYKLAFMLAHDGQTYDEKEVERSTAMKGIMQWVRLHLATSPKRCRSSSSTTARTSSRCSQAARRP
jgi:type I restriction enzyme R subunit